MSPDNQGEIARLEARLAELRAQAEPKPVDFCAVCRLTEEELGYEPLTDVTVVVADGEEGYSNVTQLLCGTDLAAYARALTNLGFIDHRHGSTSTLEDPSCYGFIDMDRCPTPTHYGNVTWGRTPSQEEER